MTPWAPVTIRLALAVMPGEDDWLILEPKTLLEKLSIDVMKPLRDTAAASGGGASIMEHAPAEVPAMPPEVIGVRRVAVTMAGMEEAATCTVEVAARTLLRWCSVIGVRRVWVSDRAKYFKNLALRLVAAHLGADHRFSVADTAWANSTVDRMMLDIAKTFRTVASVARIPLKDWVRIVPVVQQVALNAGYRKRVKASPFNSMFGRKPYSIFLALVAPGGSHGRAGEKAPRSIGIDEQELVKGARC